MFCLKPDILVCISTCSAKTVVSFVRLTLICARVRCVKILYANDIITGVDGNIVGTNAAKNATDNVHQSLYKGILDMDGCALNMPMKWN